MAGGILTRSGMVARKALAVQDRRLYQKPRSLSSTQSWRWVKEKLGSESDSVFSVKRRRMRLYVVALPPWLIEFLVYKISVKIHIHYYI